VEDGGITSTWQAESRLIVMSLCPCLEHLTGLEQLIHSICRVFAESGTPVPLIPIRQLAYGETVVLWCACVPRRGGGDIRFMSIHHNRLRKYRLDAGLSQTDVARILRLKSPASISRWERGERTPSIERLVELSALYQRLTNDLVWPVFSAARDRINRRLRQLHLG